MADLKTILDNIQDLVNQARVFQPTPPPVITDAITTVTNRANVMSGAGGVEANAALQFVKDKSYFNLIAGYLFVGTKRQFNYLDPEDLDDAYRLTGNFTNHEKGISIEKGEVVDTHIIPAELCGMNMANLGVGYYIQN